MATKMSKEEKAVRDALAQVEKDFAASTKAVETLTGGSTTSTVNKVPTGSNYGAFAESPLYKYNSLSQQDLTVGGGNTGDDKKSAEKEEDDKNTRDAFAILKDVFNSYGLSDLSATIEGFMKSGLTTSEATLELKRSPAYEARFYGNKLRAASGLNVLNEAEYLDLENSYSETLKAYGLQDYFGLAVTSEQKAARQKAIAEVMGKDISAVEFKDRVSTAVERVTNADAQTKAAFKSLYNVTDTELVKYFLDPAKNVQALKEKAAAAEIGGAALGQGLTTTAASAEELARMGITKAQAQQGYSTIAEILPTTEKLSSIYKEDQITYGQAEAEAETFKGLASAQRKRQQLAAKETATFSGQSGLAKGALGRGSAGAI
jgi:hypothetical protein